MSDDKKLLIVDDEENILKSIKRIFRKDGYQILTATNGNEALEALKENEVNVILSDQRMPHMTGSEFLAEAKKIQPDSVGMILSGYADFDAVVSAINEGSIYKFLNKPWNDNQLRETVHSAFEIYEKNKKFTEIDGLTQLLNRSAFMHELRGIWNGKEGIFVHLNLDRFINVNSAFGTEMGDKILKEVAQRLESWTKLQKGLICRLGGDEFGVIIPKNEKIWEKIICDLKDEFNMPFLIEKKTFNIKASIGVALLSKASSVDDLLSSANNALRCAKKEGRNTYKIFDDKVHKFLLKDSEIEKDLYSVVKTDQLFLEYQPLVNKTGEVKGCESLIRWNHPKYGCLPPKDFIDMSEETNVICDIGTWCLKKSVEYLKSVNEQIKKNIYVSVNLSPRQIFNTNIIEIVKETLDEYEIEPELLELEVTESLVIQDPSRCKEILEGLVDLGTKMVLDDFGTGYSSLSYLSHFPFKKFKIDRSFILDIETSQNARKMVESIIIMGKSLNMEITVEGIETAKQFEILSQFPCDFLQGYYFSKPLPEAEFEKLAVGKRKAG